MKKFLWVVLLLIVGVATYAFWPKASVDLGDSPQGALNRDAVPKSYDLALEIDPNEDQFKGEVKIAVDLNTTTNRVWLHGRGLAVQRAEIVLADQRVIQATYKEYGESGVAELVWVEALPPQSVHLHIQYQAEFSDNLNGLYKVNDDNRQYAFTQMEATYARQAFPSFDDPQFKTPFKVKITAPKDLVVIANTPALSQSAVGEKVEHVFAISKPLPTYLLAWAVGELDVVEWQAIPANSVRSVTVPLRGVATKGKGKDLNYALENTARIFDALETYFQIPYPYEKLDIIAVPDFDAGAMENAGAITYREQLLLLKDDASAQQRRSYFTTHTHELAHQWFGNLVTMPWWNDLWLNESFATWMENKIVKQVAADLGYKLNFQSDAADAMESDLLKSTRAIRQPIHFNHQIMSAFDGITYAKGGAVLAMFERFVGEEAFRQGIENYLKRYAFGSATAEQFVAEIANAANDSRVNAAFFSFLTQVGIPQLDIQSQCKENTLHISAKQQRFMPLGSQANANQVWQFPVCVASYTDTGRESQCTLMTEAEQQWTQAVTQCPSMAHYNGDGAGYYLVKQSAGDFAHTFAQLDKLSISEAYVSAKSAHFSLLAGHINQNEYMSLVPNMVRHPEREIMTAPIDVMQKIKQHTAGEQLPAFKAWLAKQWSPALAQIGVEPKESDSDDTRLLRTTLLNFLLEIAESRELRADFKDKGMAFIGYGSDNKIHEDALRPDIRRLAMSVAVNDLGKPYFDALTDALDSTSDGTIRNAIIGALGSADDKALAEEARDMVTGLSLRVNERVAILGRQLVRSPERAGEVFDWFKGKYRLIKGMLPESIQDNVPMIGMFFCSEPKRQEVDAYFTPLMPEMPGAQRALDNTLETIHLCSTFVAAQPELQLPN